MTVDAPLNDIVDLNMDEIDEVSGGIAPLAYAAIVVVLHLGAVAMAVRDAEAKKKK